MARSLPVRHSTGAFEANLARTAVEVPIPAEHRPLLEITERWRGVHDATEALLREVHHPHPGWAQTLADLHRRAMGDFHYLSGHPRGAEAIAIICDLYVAIIRDARPRNVREDAVRRWLAYLEYVARQSRADAERNGAVIAESLLRLEAVLREAPDLVHPASGGLRRLTETLAQAPAGSLRRVARAAGAVLLAALDRLYERWLAREDPASWLAQIGAPAPGEETPHPVTHTDLRRMRERLRRLAEDPFPVEGVPSELVGLPDDRSIIRSYLVPPPAFDGSPAEVAMTRIRWLLRVLERPELAPAHETALRDVKRTCSEVLANAGGAAPRDVIHRVFALVRDHPFPRRTTVLELIQGLGQEVLAGSDPELVDALVDEVLAADFEYPGFRGFTEEWDVRVNPDHVAALRTHLRIIATDPVAARPILAALVAHLHFGGVSITDSALFQRDVSSFLAADIRPVYVQVKHLLRLLPVYFSEIGAEGELRAVSTRIDEALQRRDPLCNFLRKQSHVECNPHLIDFVEEIARFWATGERGPLAAYVPWSLYEALDADDPSTAGVHTAFAELTRQTGSVEGIFALELDDLRARLAAIPGTDATDRERAELLVRVWREIRRKYALEGSDIVPRLRAFLRVDGTLVSGLEESLRTGADADALDHALSVLERLQEIVLRRGETAAQEDIYYKRHIAAGIPSMYGSYREERLDAMGLTFRLQSLTGTLMDRVMAPDALPADRPDRLREVAGRLRRLHRALRIDGFRAQGIAHGLAMLDEALDRPATSPGQLLDIFRILSHNLESTIRSRILDVYDGPSHRVVGRMLERGILPGGWGEEAVLRHSEAFLRELIAGSLGLQRFDAVVGRTIGELRDDVHPAAPVLAARTAVEDALVPLMSAPESLGAVALGKKASMLRHLARIGMRVPDGFVLTTDVFGMRDELRRSGGARARLERAVRAQVRRLEERAGARFGDPRNPLLLSVRGGAPLSMPGMLATYLNVGLSASVMPGFAARRGEWAAWDADRRFVQSWGMGHGLERDRFDELIAAAKRRGGVPRKALLSPADMRRLAGEYRRLVAAAGIPLEDDPVRQLMACIDLVHASWDGPGASLYRRELQIADEWGTAVIVQAMVFGNLGPRSGSGVLLTTDPLRTGDARELSGDFTVQSQGDDVVGGLVATFPITERQRRREARDVDVSLEKDFPAIHAALCEVADSLLERHGMNHQEIEFTFESDRACDLYLLQTRDTVVAPHTVLPAFIPGPALDSRRVGAGIGVSGGALSGRLVHTAEDIADLRARRPEAALILARPDTVPDDVALVLACEGLLTALGGATSHAAVAAKRLGKTCVVGCRGLDVDERHGRSRIGTHLLRTGDVVSISGLDGTVYLGAHPVELVGVRGRAQQ